jgi:hypothetical protein
MCVLHRCDTPGCVRPTHLFLGTHADNVRDKTAKGRTPRGHEHYQSRFTSEQVAAIRDTWEHGESMRSIGRRYGVSHESIRRIVRHLAYT